MNKVILGACACFLIAPPAKCQIIDYGAAAGAAGLGTGLGAGAGAAKLMVNQTSKVAPMSAAMLRQAQTLIDKAVDMAKGKEKLGDWLNAAVFYTQVAQIRQKYFGKDDSVAGQSYLTAAKLQDKAKNYTGAEASYKASLAICAHNAGPGSSQSIPILSGLGSALNAQNRFGEAITYFKQALSLEERSDGVDSESANETRLQLANVAMKCADFSTAESVLAKAMSLEEAKGAKNSPQYLNVLTSYEDLLRQTLKLKDADRIAEKISAAKSSNAAASLDTSKVETNKPSEKASPPENQATPLTGK